MLYTKVYWLALILRFEAGDFGGGADVQFFEQLDCAVHGFGAVRQHFEARSLMRRALSAW